MSSSEPPATGSASSLGAAIRLLLDRWWILLLCLVIGAAAFVLNDTRKTKQYESTATLLSGSTSTNVGSLLNNAANNVSADPQRDQGTTLLLVTSSSVAERVRRQLRYAGPAGDLSKVITAAATPDANLIDVSATDPSPERAAQLANAFAEQYRSFRRDTDTAGLTEGIRGLTEQLNALPVTATDQRQTLRASIATLQAQNALANGGVQVVDRATPSSTPSSPLPKRDAVLGAILGLAIGAALVFAIDLLDRRLRSVRDFEVAYGQAALAGVPLQRTEPRSAGERQKAMEPYRMLRVSLGQVSRTGRPHVILVTSAVPGEGKSTTASGLANAVAFAGQRVVLVELDLRRPTFHQRFELGRESTGLAGVLQGRTALEDAIVRPFAELPTLEVLPAGGMPARSAELLSGPYMQHVLGELAERAEIVILDAPPLLPVADTLAILDFDLVDTVVVVGKPGHTTRDQCGRVRTILQQHRWDGFGIVVNGLIRDEGTYDYDYGSPVETERGLVKA